MFTCYTVPEIWGLTDVIVIFHFGLFFAFYPANSPKNQNLKKIKNNLEISSFYICVPKIMINDVRFLSYDKRRTDGRKK